MQDHDALLWTLGAVSLVMFVGTLIAVPILVVRIPHDYFAGEARHHTRWEHHHPAVRMTLLILKNLVGVVFVVAGLTMLVLPGQGILTMLIGLVLIDFPGKYRFERWLVRRGPVRRSINWLRRKRGRDPLLLADTT